MRETSMYRYSLSALMVVTSFAAIAKPIYLQCGNAVVSFDETTRTVVDGTYIKGFDRFTMMGEVSTSRHMMDGTSYDLKQERRIYRFDEEIIQWGWMWLPNPVFHHAELHELNRMTGRLSTPYGTRTCEIIESSRKF